MLLEEEEPAANYGLDQGSNRVRKGVESAPKRGAEKKALKKREGERGVEQEGRRGERRGGKL